MRTKILNGIEQKLGFAMLKSEDYENDKIWRISYVDLSINDKFYAFSIKNKCEITSEKILENINNLLDMGKEQDKRLKERK